MNRYTRHNIDVGDFLLGYVKEYYDVAPGVVKAINSSEKKDEYYQDIYNTIVRCMEKIEAKKDKRAVALYLDMFYKYKDLFNDIVVDNKDKTNKTI